MLLTDGPLTLREFVTREPLLLATIFREILTYLTTRTDVVVFGEHAVNAYCEPERMTAEIDLLSTNAAPLADDVRRLLSDRFHIAVRVREVVPGGFRIYQLRQPKNRHLVDVRQVEALPSYREMEGVRVLEPSELAAMKAISMTARIGHEKGLSDRLNLHRLLRAFPQLRADESIVAARMRALGASAVALDAWTEVSRQPLQADDDEA